RAAPARRRPRPALGRRARARRRPADAPALARWAPALRQQLALLELGQPVLSGPALVAVAGELPGGRRYGGRRRVLRRPVRAARRPRPRPRGPPPGRRLHDGDLPVTLAHIA